MISATFKSFISRTPKFQYIIMCYVNHFSRASQMITILRSVTTKLLNCPSHNITVFLINKYILIQLAYKHNFRCTYEMDIFL